jgi:hypothetical protein
MRALDIFAGPAARAHLAQHGLLPQHICTIPAAAGGPKGLILGPLDRYLFGHWLPQSSQSVHLVGASIGAWRMAAACLNQPQHALARLERDYIGQHYAMLPGEKRPAPARVSALFGHNLQAFYGGRVDEVLQHPRYRLHVLTSRGRGPLRRERAGLTLAAYLAAFASNLVSRRTLGVWLQRVVFSSPQVGGMAAANLPFDPGDYPTQQVTLTEANFFDALQASCSIPFVLQAVHDIAGAPAGAYWDGGVTDYHLHLNYGAGQNTIKSVAAECLIKRATGQNTLHNPALPAGLVLYPHFQRSVVPGWLDKHLRWRHGASPFLDNMLLLAPNPEWVKTLPNGKLPDRGDFTHYGEDLAARMRVWHQATAAAEQLAQEFDAWLAKPDLGLVHRL